MNETKADFVPVGALDPRAAKTVSSTAQESSQHSNGVAPRRGPTRLELIRGLVKQAPFVGKNFQLYFRNGWRRHVLHTKVVAPYAVTFYVTHKCNLACSYCTQKEPDVFSQELPTAGTLKVLAKIRQETDSIVITGGEPTLRSDIETIVEAARFKNKFRSVLLITNGTLLDRKPKILDAVTGLVVSLDALQADPVIEEWNIAEVQRLLDWCGEQGFVFAAQSAQMEKMPNLALLQNPKYQALVETIIARRRENKQPINGTPRTIDTLLRFRHFECFPTMFPRVYPNGDVFYPCEPLRKIAGNLLHDGSLAKIFARGKKRYGEIPPCQGICYLFGNVLSHYYVNDFWGLAGDFIS